MSIFNKLGKLFKQKIVQTQSVFVKNSTTKHSITSSCTLKLSTETEKKKTEINEKLKGLIKKYINSPEKLIQFMQLKGMKVYKFRNANKILSKIGEEEGFLTPLKGYKALVLNFIIGILFEEKIKISFSTKEMFIFNTGNTEIYSVARALHKYYGYKKELPGYDYKSQEIFKRIYNNKKNQSASLDKCSVKDIFACKEALSRDLESINFTIQISLEHERAKKALNTLINEKSAKI